MPPLIIAYECQNPQVLFDTLHDDFERFGAELQQLF